MKTMCLATKRAVLTSTVLLGVTMATASDASLAASRSNQCFDAVQGKIAWDTKGQKTKWNPKNVRKLCKGAEQSTEPAECFRRVMHEDAAGDGWRWRSAIELCQGVHDADGRIGCAAGMSSTGMKRSGVIDGCRNVAKFSETNAPAVAVDIENPREKGDAHCRDRDGDGHRDVECGGDDCDDTNPSRFPGNFELCNDEDEDCDPTTFGSTDDDGDGFVDEKCCNPTPRGGMECGRDCDDDNALITPGAQICLDARHVEICGGSRDSCPRASRCVTQPNGTGICVPK